MRLRRIFAAIELSDEARAATAAYAGRLRDEFPADRVRWERPEKYHITLRFEAKADEAAVERIQQLMTQAAADAVLFDLELAGTGTFQSRRGPAILWLGVNGEGQARSALRSTVNCLHEGEARKFHPHVTIARLKHLTADARKLIDGHLASHFEPVRFTVDHLTLFESTLRSSGSVYEALGRYQLATRA